MSNNKWDDEHIENLLRDFPKIHDERPKEEVYLRLKNHRPVTNGKAKRWLPLMVAALAFVTFGILLASLLSQGSQNEMSGADQAEEQGSITSGESESGERAAEDAAGISESADEESAETFSMMEAQSQTVAVYEEDLENHALFTVGLTENAFVIPVSFLIPDQQVEQDLGAEDVNTVNLYNEYAGEIDEEALGFDEYHPYLGTISLSGQRVEHQLPEDHQYDMASAAIGVYTASLKETFRGAEEIAVVQEDGSLADFDQVGQLEPLEASVTNVAYYAYTTARGDIYVTPDYGMEYTSPTEAFNAMTEAPNDFHHPLIPGDMSFTVTETEDIIELEFSEAVNLENLEKDEAVRMIEGLSLTAKSFGKQVRLRNVVQEQWDRYDFTAPLPMPAAANRLEWPIN
ncbi:hypothetical protein [Planococcus salinus]|uniref:GerMN domain-containing protein n=1 Tax=Planococcus salinus TaxID=1848460 RepID=A0A3M8P9Z0_9BACL|nr:hypothetical protein [Planococcus salinus]RNF40525.1 hypothetical protein EEX84_03630 [Planococcus salinus]